MLGHRIMDEHGVESAERDMPGLGLLNIETSFNATKTTCLADAELRAPFSEHSPPNAQFGLKGYEIHMGESSGDIDLFRIRRSGSETWILDGSRNGSCWGTYLHGLFDNDMFRRAVLNDVRARKGLPPLESGASCHAMRDAALARLADVVREHCDLDAVRRMIAR